MLIFYMLINTIRRTLQFLLTSHVSGNTSLSQARAQAVAVKLSEEGCENRFVVIPHADGHPKVGAQMLVRIVPRPDSDGDGVWPECDCEARVNGGGCHALGGGGGPSGTRYADQDTPLRADANTGSPGSRSHLPHSHTDL